MVDRSLVEQIAAWIKKGYDPDYLRTQLVKQGYSPVDVNRAIALAQPRKKKNKLVLFGIIGMFVVVVGIALFLFIPKGGDVNVLITLNPSADTVKEGGTLTFETYLKNTDDAPLTVTLSHEIRTLQGDIVQSVPDSVTLRREASIPSRVDVRVSPGTYALVSTARFDGRSKQEQFQFTVAEQELPTTGGGIMLAECPEGCNDFTRCTEDFCKEGRCVFVPIRPCCGDGVCDEGEGFISCSEDCAQPRTEDVLSLTESAREAVTKNKDRAAEYCQRIVLETERDDCFAFLAEDSHDQIFCSPMTRVNRKDACYLQFALDGNSAVCAQIIDERMQATCYNYARFVNIAPA